MHCFDLFMLIDGNAVSCLSSAFFQKDKSLLRYWICIRSWLVVMTFSDGLLCIAYVECLVGGFKHFLFSIIYGIIIPTDQYFRGVETTNQMFVLRGCDDSLLRDDVEVRMIFTGPPFWRESRRRIRRGNRAGIGRLKWPWKKPLGTIIEWDGSPTKDWMDRGESTTANDVLTDHLRGRQ